MNTTSLKRFATAARKKLISQITAKLDYVLSADSAELRERREALAQLRTELTQTTKAELIERVAYTWFNRFVALRFLDINDFQPMGIRAVSPIDGYTTPQLLDEAKQGHIPADLTVDHQRINDLLDGRLPSRDPQNEVYGLLLTATCNALNAPLPFLFEPLADYTELLMPDDLLSPQSVLTDVREGMSADDCREVEVIGWLYQFYISERKDAVFAAKSKVQPEDIPAATQLFTPRWVVEYMVQNTVGKLWLRNKPGSGLKALMPYYLESPSENTYAFLPVSSTQELTLLDPASGSGHILVYAFELLAHIYEEEGYSRTEIPALILQHNLTGFDIDERAAQLASFALTMKARQYDRRFFRRNVLPRVVALHKLTQGIEADWRSLLHEVGCTYLDPIIRDLKLMTEADNLGALIRPETPEADLTKAAEGMSAYASQPADLFRQPLAHDLSRALAHLALLARKHACVVANPPYMGGGAMNAALSAYVKAHYPDSKADLMACFMESGLSQCQPDGYLGMINQHSWMFLGSYEALRKKLIDSVLFDTLLHLGPRTFPEIGGEVVQNAAFTFQNHTYPEPPAGRYVRLVELKNTAEKAANVHTPSLTFHARQDNFEKIPGEVIGYWLSENIFKLFDRDKVENISISDGQMVTGDNNRFLREFWEISATHVGINRKWLMYAKGGAYRKWYGSITNVIDWSEGARTHYRKDRISRLLPEYLWYRKGITWTLIATNNPSFRFLPIDSVFDKTGSSIFFTDDSYINYILGLNNSIAGYKLISVLNPTLAIQVRDVRNLPFVNSDNHFSTITSLVQSCINISREDWDARETSWDFRQNELLRHKTSPLLAEAVATYETYWQANFSQLHRNEEALNCLFIDIYGLQDELTPEVSPDDITILQQEAKPVTSPPSPLSLKQGEGGHPQSQDYVLQFDRKELMAQFISYAVGCMFGRYSLQKEGLVLASQGQTLEDYINQLSEQADVSFLPDADNIIPVLDEDWFADDIVARFREFLRVSFGPDAFPQNLQFVEESLGMDIRKWFTKYFYDDHVRRYRRRPIYWLFSSPKRSFNVLIYLHRYTPDTVSRILNGYLRTYQEKLRSRREHYAAVMVSASATASEKTRAQRESDRLEKILTELAQYERDVIYPLATQHLALDLDDGVLVNYNRFGAALAPVKGLTGAKGEE